MALVACQTKAPSCDAAAWEALIGQPVSAAAVIPHPKRMIPPDHAVTLDYQPDRTNIDLDATGKITRIHCG